MTHQFAQFNQYCDNDEELQTLAAYADDCKRDADNYLLANAFISRIVKRADDRSE